MKIYGFRRPDGQVGFRNYVAIIPTVMCSSVVATQISQIVTGTVALPHPHGCSQLENDRQRTLRTLAGLGKNPNVASVLVVGLGCENVTVKELVEEISKSGKEVVSITIQEVGGTPVALGQGIVLAQELTRKASLMQREEVSWSEVILGLKCGGSDASSGIASNPALGIVADLLIAKGGTAVLCETTELIGAEHLLAERTINQKVKHELLVAVSGMEEAAVAGGMDLRGTQPSPGNMTGGITTIEEKSLGCIYKAGSTPLQEVVDYAFKPNATGLVLMDTPGNDLEAVTGLVAGGTQVIVFTTGCGTPTGSALAPVIKVSGNPHTSVFMKSNIDVDVSKIISGHETIHGAGQKLFEEIALVLNGKLTTAESLGHKELAISRIARSF